MAPGSAVPRADQAAQASMDDLQPDMLRGS
jgi:hypothetical protein